MEWNIIYSPLNSSWGGLVPYFSKFHPLKRKIGIQEGWGWEQVQNLLTLRENPEAAFICMQQVPSPCLAYEGGRNMFATWLTRDLQEQHQSLIYSEHWWTTKAYDSPLTSGLPQKAHAIAANLSGHPLHFQLPNQVPWALDRKGVVNYLRICWECPA